MSLHFTIIAALSILGSGQSSFFDLSRVDAIAGGSKCSSSKPATKSWPAERRIVVRHRAAPSVQILSFGP